jgi:hypothetical protein
MFTATKITTNKTRLFRKNPIIDAIDEIRRLIEIYSSGVKLIFVIESITSKLSNTLLVFDV